MGHQHSLSGHDTSLMTTAELGKLNFDTRVDTHDGQTRFRVFTD